MYSHEQLRSLLPLAWDQHAAINSMQRWDDLCAKENWGSIPENIEVLVKLFGSSWYFTRYVFYRGLEIVDLIDKPQSIRFDAMGIFNYMKSCLHEEKYEDQLDQLILLKNEVMLLILISYLQGMLDQQQVEESLTHLADASLRCAMTIFKLDSELKGEQTSILGMGRMAGYEMTFGSDLDLIFLYDAGTESHVADITRKIRSLLRNIASVKPIGILYEVDMRLRPHGTAGALTTEINSFVEYHQENREIWERQMMTRCRPVYDPSGLAAETMQNIMPSIYTEYDEKELKAQIVSMRERVEGELGKPSGKYELKRGKGGIMDIDFITHYLQLLHGQNIPELQTGSTRVALNKLQGNNIISNTVASDLSDAYDFLKQVELSLRLFDLKSISSFNKQPAANKVLARAMGYTDREDEFISRYLDTTNNVRQHFLGIVAV